MRNMMLVSMFASFSLMACTAETVDEADLGAPEGAQTELVAAPPITMKEAFDLSRGSVTSRPAEDGLDISDREATDRARCGQGEWIRLDDDSPEAQKELEAFKAAFTDVSGIDVGRCSMCGYDWSCWLLGKDRYKTGYYINGICIAGNTSQCCN